LVVSFFKWNLLSLAKFQEPSSVSTPEAETSSLLRPLEQVPPADGERTQSLKRRDGIKERTLDNVQNGEIKKNGMFESTVNL
jgi:hypothetical protein